MIKNKDKNGKMKLCGGIFFGLLLEDLIYKGYKQSGGFSGKKKEMPNFLVLLNLCKVIKPSINMNISYTMKASISGATSDYMYCKKNGGSTYFVFEDDLALEHFKKEYETKFDVLANRMAIFTNEFLSLNDEYKLDVKLVKALFELIKSDVDENILFVIDEKGKTVSKNELLKSKKICLETFLLSVLRYIIDVDNTLGEGFANEIFPPAGGGQRKYDGNLGECIKNDIKLIYIKPDRRKVGKEKNDVYEQVEYESSSTDNNEESDKRNKKFEEAFAKFRPNIIVTGGNNNVGCYFEGQKRTNDNDK